MDKDGDTFRLVLETPHLPTLLIITHQSQHDDLTH